MLGCFLWKVTPIYQTKNSQFAHVMWNRFSTNELFIFWGQFPYKIKYFSHSNFVFQNRVCFKGRTMTKIWCFKIPSQLYLCGFFPRLMSTCALRMAPSVELFFICVLYSWVQSTQFKTWIAVCGPRPNTFIFSISKEL